MPAPPSETFAELQGGGRPSDMFNMDYGSAGWRALKPYEVVQLPKAEYRMWSNRSRGGEEKKRIQQLRRKATNAAAARRAAKRRKAEQSRVDADNDRLQAENERIRQQNALLAKVLKDIDLMKPVKEFNRALKEADLPAAVVADLRKLRRRINNARYAKASRARKRSRGGVGVASEGYCQHVRPAESTEKMC